LSVFVVKAGAAAEIVNVKRVRWPVAFPPFRGKLARFLDLKGRNLGENIRGDRLLSLPLFRSKTHTGGCPAHRANGRQGSVLSSLGGLQQQHVTARRLAGPPRRQSAESVRRLGRLAVGPQQLRPALLAGRTGQPPRARQPRPRELGGAF